MSNEKIFENHQLQVLADTPEVRRYYFGRKETNTYSFTLTTANNLIVLTGDIGTLIIEPGYDRDGLSFMRRSLNSEDYFLSKAPREIRTALTEYCPAYALEDIKEWLDLEYIKEEIYKEFLDRLGDETGQYGESKYWELCYDLGIEEPPRATRMHPQVKLQLAGLRAALKAIDSGS